jgi:hypothetical protein
MIFIDYFILYLKMIFQMNFQKLLELFKDPYMVIIEFIIWVLTFL